MDAFISHSSKNRAVAAKLESALEAEGLRVWLDDSEIRLGVLLREELQTSIQRSRVLLLLWSKPASASRWINAEWLMAFHLGRFIVPCTLDDTALPQCLGPSVFLNLILTLLRKPPGYSLLAHGVMVRIRSCWLWRNFTNGTVLIW